ncbi:sigma-54-dependent transcriptional regulator [Candidatus Margulisiibacteriota bacterium]
MKDTKANILVVDDTPNTLEILQRSLSSQGYGIHLASNVADAMDILKKTAIDLVITDYKMPVANGLDLIRHIKENYLDKEIIMITGYPTITGAVKAVKGGADEYLCKPFTDEELFASVKNVLEKVFIRKSTKNKSASSNLERQGMIGESKEMQKIYRIIKKTAKTSATALITGESGTGKELAARSIHYNSQRASAPFVPIHCGAIPESLFESELFGYVKGAFTGADQSRAGFFQSAEGGTVFLDEVSEISLSLQVKLLRVLQNKEFYMVGSTKPYSADIRIIAATNKDLLSLVNKGLFREDLYYRLNVITIKLPQLREREDDIFLLINHFANKFSRELGITKPEFSDDTLSVLKKYSWPGNIRELENIIQQLLVMVEGGKITIPDLPSFMRFSPHMELSLNKTLAEVEADYIQRVLDSVNNNKSQAARILGIDRRTLREKIVKKTN